MTATMRGLALIREEDYETEIRVDTVSTYIRLNVPDDNVLLTRAEAEMLGRCLLHWAATGHRTLTEVIVETPAYEVDGDARNAWREQP